MLIATGIIRLRFPQRAPFMILLAGAVCEAGMLGAKAGSSWPSLSSRFNCPSRIAACDEHKLPAVPLCACLIARSKRV
jgi:hypothetical protein